MLRFAILREVGAESWTLSVPVIAETVAVAWVKVAEALSTFVVIVFLSIEAASVNLFFLEYLVFDQKLLLIEDARQQTVFFTILLAVSIFVQESCDSARGQVDHVADIRTRVCGEVGECNQHLCSSVTMSDDLNFVAGACVFNGSCLCDKVYVSRNYFLAHVFNILVTGCISKLCVSVRTQTFASEPNIIARLEEGLRDGVTLVINC